MMHRESCGIFPVPKYNKSTPAASNEQCRQQGGGLVLDVVKWKRDGAGGCQNFLRCWPSEPPQNTWWGMNFGPFRDSVISNLQGRVDQA